MPVDVKLRNSNGVTFDGDSATVLDESRDLIIYRDRQQIGYVRGDEWILYEVYMDDDLDQGSGSDFPQE